MIRVVFIFSFFCKILYPQYLHLESITVKDGLSNSYINCLLQDDTGFLWIGTDDGLNRFDGYEIKIFRNKMNDKSSISENIIWALCEDHIGNIWIGTKSGGLNRYNPKTEMFESWNLPSSDAEEINITFICEDSKYNIWIGTYRNGIYRFNPTKMIFEHWQNYPGKQKLLTDNFVTSILEDQFSNIWVGTFGGLNLYTPEENHFPFKEVIKDIKVPVWYLSRSLFFKNNIWIGTLNGLMKYDLSLQKLDDIELPTDDGLHFGKSVSALVEENYLDERILWISSYDGLVRINLNSGFKERFIENKKANSGLLSNEIHDLILDKSGVVWIGTESGLNFYSSKRSKFNTRIPAIGKIFESPGLFNDNIRAITQSKNGSIWFGTETGLIEMQNQYNDLEIVKSAGLNALNVWCLIASDTDKLWIGTYGQGLKEFDLNKRKLISWNTVNPAFNENAFNYVRVLYEDTDGKLWIGYWGGGLARLNTKNSKIELKVIIRFVNVDF